MPRLASIATIAAFAACLACSVAAQNNPESPIADAPPAPSSGEQARILEETRRIALEYTANLPNFICTKTIQRSSIAKSGQPWKLADTLKLDLAFSDKGESHKLLSIDYRLATIGEQQFVLPRHAELILTARNGRQARNVMEFSNYRKFSAEATFSFEKD